MVKPITVKEKLYFPEPMPLTLVREQALLWEGDCSPLGFSVTDYMKYLTCLYNMYTRKNAQPVPG